MGLLPVKEISRRSQVLKAPDFGCLKGVPAVNVTRGCLHRCVYCYARSFPETPQGEVHLYADLPERLAKEIASRQRRGRLPAVVTFSTASDLFQPHPRLLKTTYRALKLLLERGVTVSFLTKGRIPQDFWDLFRAHPGLVKARFGLVSLSPAYHRLFEPLTASAFLRLRQMEKALELGLEPTVRIDPVIPGVTDGEEQIESLLRHLAAIGLKEVSVSYLVLRPGVKRKLQQELPAGLLRDLLAAYRGMPWTKVITSATTKLARREKRERGYRLFREIGRAYGLSVRICGCKNPDLPFEDCSPWNVTPRGPRQGELFGEIKMGGRS